MLGDVLLITEKHKAAAELIVDYILKNKTHKMMIGISGESGSGKTELSHVIARLLRDEKICAKPIHTDNYYNTHPLDRKEYRVRHGIKNVVGYDEYNWDAISQTLADFKAGRISEMPCVDLMTEQVDRLITDFHDVDMLILDGLYAIKAEELDVKVFIELTYEDTKKKHVKDSRGKEKMDQVRWDVLGQEHEMVSKLEKNANLIVNKNYEVRVIEKK